MPHILETDECIINGYGKDYFDQFLEAVKLGKPDILDPKIQ